MAAAEVLLVMELQVKMEGEAAVEGAVMEVLLLLEVQVIPHLQVPHKEIMVVLDFIHLDHFYMEVEAEAQLL